MRRNTLAAQILSFAVSLLIVAAGIFGFSALVYKPDIEASAKVPPPDPVVTTTAIRAHIGTLDIVVDGVVTPFREIEVAAEVAGKILTKAEGCNGGRFVTRGTPLIKIDPEDYQLAAERLKNQLEQADANIEELNVEIGNSANLIELAEDQLQLEQNEVNRLAGLIQERIVTDSTLDRAKQTELSARNSVFILTNQLRLLEARKPGLQSARKLVATDLEKAQLDLKRTDIVAAVDGVVIDDFVEEGSFVQKGTPVFKLEDTSAVEVKCRLKMQELNWIWRQAGQEFAAGGTGYQIPQIPVTIIYSMSDSSDVEYEWDGVLARFDGIGMDEATRTVPCRVRVDEPRAVKVKPRNKDASPGPGENAVRSTGLPALVRGMFVSVEFHVDQPSPLLEIPERAVQPGKTLWIVKNEQLQEKRSLELIELIPGKDTEESRWLVEASSTGLAAGDRVVVPPFGILRHKDAVDERPEEDKLQEEGSR